MRLVQVMIPAGERDAILDVLKDQGVDYALSEETSGREYTAVVWFPLPTSAVEAVLEELRSAGLDESAYTVVLDAQTVVSRDFDRLQERYDESDDAERIAREELVATAGSLAPDWGPFVVMTVISAVVATAGVLLDSAAVVVGSMVIAPLIGPAMATSVGTVVGDGDLFGRGVKLQLFGAILAVGAATVFAGVLRFSNAVPAGAAEVLSIGEVRERLAPDLLSLVVALAAGVAGALSLSTGVSAALVGVMIAAALVPPIAVVGVGIAWGQPGAVVGSGVLVVVNVLSINLAALAVLWYQGYLPEQWFQAAAARRSTLQRVAGLAAAILLLSSFLGGVTVVGYERATFEDDARGAAAAVVADAGGDLVAFDVEYEGNPPLETGRTVRVTVGHPPGTDPPPVAGSLADRIAPIVDRPLELGTALGVGTEPSVTVEVRYVVHETATSDGTASDRAAGGLGGTAAAESASLAGVVV